MELTIEMILMLYGPSLAKLKLLEFEVDRLARENAALKAQVEQMRGAPHDD